MTETQGDGNRNVLDGITKALSSGAGAAILGIVSGDPALILVIGLVGAGLPTVLSMLQKAVRKGSETREVPK